MIQTSNASDTMGDLTTVMVCYRSNVLGPRHVHVTALPSDYALQVRCSMLQRLFWPSCAIFRMALFDQALFAGYLHQASIVFPLTLTLANFCMADSKKLWLSRSMSAVIYQFSWSYLTWLIYISADLCLHWTVCFAAA